MDRKSRLEVIRALRERTQQIERSRRAPQTGCVSTGCAAFDELLSGLGFEWGTLAEWLNEGEASGGVTLALAVSANVLRHGGACVMIDAGGDFYPPAAAHLGVPLERMIVVQPKTSRATLWAWEQSLRCSGVAVTVGRFDAIGDRVFRRLQLAAEAGGGVGFLLRPAVYRNAPSWAAVRLAVRSLPGPGSLEAPRRRLRIERLDGKSGSTIAALNVELNHDETSHVHLVSPLAAPAMAHRTTPA